MEEAPCRAPEAQALSKDLVCKRSAPLWVCETLRALIGQTAFLLDNTQPMLQCAADLQSSVVSERQVWLIGTLPVQLRLQQ